jgi:hypothetical protein
MILKIINDIGKRKLEIRSIICASSFAAGGGGGGGGGGGIAKGVTRAGGVDCCETPDIDTAESTCNELLLCCDFFIELE